MESHALRTGSISEGLRVRSIPPPSDSGGEVSAPDGRRRGVGTDRRASSLSRHYRAGGSRGDRPGEGGGTPGHRSPHHRRRAEAALHIEAKLVLGGCGLARPSRGAGVREGASSAVMYGTPPRRRVQRPDAERTTGGSAGALAPLTRRKECEQITEAAYDPYDLDRALRRTIDDQVGVNGPRPECFVG